MDLRSRAAGLRQQMQPQRNAAGPPQENGIRLATIPRADGTELRLSWAEYNGKPFLNVRVWTQDSNGAWWPDRTKGLSIRVRELADFADGLEKALEMAARVLGSQVPSSAPAASPSQPARPGYTCQGLDDLPPLRPAGR